MNKDPPLGVLRTCKIHCVIVFCYRYFKRGRMRGDLVGTVVFKYVQLCWKPQLVLTFGCVLLNVKWQAVVIIFYV